MTEVVARPVFDPARSLGWRTGPLDGLSCLLRCLESLLRARGFDNLALARAMVNPLDLTGGRLASAHFRGGHLTWRSAVDGTRHWAELAAVCQAGEHVILMPDRYYWPGDEFEGVKHFLDHMVLVVSVDERELVVLDTDAPVADHYTRHLPVTGELVRSACRFATAHFQIPVDIPQTLRDTLLEPMGRWVAEDLPALASFARRWEDLGLTGPLARALHVVVLGEWQPNLFLTGVAVADTHPEISAAATAAAGVARDLGKALLGAHRYAGRDPEDTTVYRPVLPPGSCSCPNRSNSAETAEPPSPLPTSSPLGAAARTCGSSSASSDRNTDRLAATIFAARWYSPGRLSPYGSSSPPMLASSSTMPPRSGSPRVAAASNRKGTAASVQS